MDDINSYVGVRPGSHQAKESHIIWFICDILNIKKLEFLRNCRDNPISSKWYLSSPNDVKSFNGVKNSLIVLDVTSLGSDFAGDILQTVIELTTVYCKNINLVVLSGDEPDLKK